MSLNSLTFSLKNFEFTRNHCAVGWLLSCARIAFACTCLALLSTSLHAQTTDSTPSNNAPVDQLVHFLRERGMSGMNGISQPIQQGAAQVSDVASRLVVHAMGFIGVPYKLGGNSPDQGGLDCSGFVRAVFSQMTGQLLPRKADQQAAATASIEQSELKPGDLVFFNTLKRSFSHVGIYIGEGRFVHSPRPGGEVRVDRMQQAYWANRFDGARRPLAASADQK